jgi:two-component system LytT family sensor kinase
MPDRPKPGPRTRTALVIISVFTFKFILLTPQVYFYNASSHAPLPWGLVWAKLALGTYTWALLTPLILLASRRWYVERRNLSRNLLIHFLLSFAFASAQTFLYHLGLTLLEPAGWDAAMNETPRLDAAWSFVFNGTLAYVSIVAVHQAVLHFRLSREKELRLQQSQLQLLKAQLRPHFLFNTLNTIASLIYSDQAEAERTVVNLSDMLRFNLYEMDSQETTLRDELEFASKYVQIMKARHEGRFRFVTRVDPLTLGARVPVMLIQPLVENSLLHAVLPRDACGTVEVRAWRDGGTLCIQVSDDGDGGARDRDTAASGAGIGLANMRARLKYLYGPDYKLELLSRNGGGTTASVRLPFREDHEDASDAREAVMSYRHV